MMVITQDFLLICTPYFFNTMVAPQITENESERLEALYNYDILDTEPEKEFDDLVKLASQICETPISLVSLVDNERQWFKAKVGLKARETPRDVSFCAHAIHDDQIMVVNDAREDERFADNPLVMEDPNIRFYAGVPLVSPQGVKLGTLCVIDTYPRDLENHQRFALETLSQQVIKQMELKLHNRELKKSLEKIETQNHKLNKLNQINGKLLSIISHDLRSPLTSMSGFLSLFGEDSLSQDEVKKTTEGLQIMLSSSTELLDNLLQWGATCASDDVIKLQTLQLDDLINDIKASAQVMANDKDNTIYSHVEDNYTLRADSVMLRFVIRNLIQNAIKFTEGGVIEIFAEEKDYYHWITIRDSGVGMDTKKLNKLFSWESRTSTLGTSGEKGSGLGLILCQEFVEHHGGTIQVNSKPGWGSTFAFSLSK
jgi:signal transduction histidine kinase